MIRSSSSNSSFAHKWLPTLTHALIYSTIKQGVGALSKLEKLLLKIKNNPKQVRFEELDKILTRAGFIKRQSSKGTSHYVYKKGELKISIPYRQPHILETYVIQAIKLLEKHFSNESDTEE